MKPVKEITVNVDELLSVNKYEVDEENAHIELVEDPSDEEFRKLVKTAEDAEAIVRKALVQGGRDNTTVLQIRVNRTVIIR